MSAIALDPLIAEAKRRARRRRTWSGGALIAALLTAIGVSAWAAWPGGGDSFVMRGRGPAIRETGYVSGASALSRIGIEKVGSSGGVTWASNSDGTTWLTTNGGRTWRYTNPHGWGLQFVDKRHGWAIGACGAERTTDGGRTWQCSSPKVCPERCDNWSTSINFLDARHGFFLEGGRQATWLLRTSDGGRTWQHVSQQPEWFGPIRFVNARLGFAGDGPMQPRWYVGPPIHKTLYRTTDGGATWSPHRVGGSNGWVEEPRVFGGRLVLAQSPPNPDPSGVNENLRAIWASADAGAHWSGRPVPLVDQWGIPPSAVSLASPRDVVVAHGADLYMTSDGGARWSDVSLRGLPSSSEITQLAFTSSRVGWAVIYVRPGIDGTLFRTTDAGLHWTPAGPLKPKRHGHT
jgi:photosystem II stability/assembly factor-like uncharacterized protein